MRTTTFRKLLGVVVAALLMIAAPGVATPAVAQEPLLSRGDTGPAVEEWQSNLNDWLQVARTEQGRLATDGIYGPLTEAATRDFQQAANITVDGIVGPETRSALDAAITEDVGAGQQFLDIGDTGSAVAQWQENLNAVLEPDIATDGIYGPVTRETTRDFQASVDIAVDGIVGPQTRGAMEDALDQGIEDTDTGDEGLNADEVLSDSIDTSTDTGGASGAPVTVTDVRVGSHDGFDRVTLAIGGDGQAGWEVGYVAEPAAQGSGQAIDVAGDAFLQVRLTNIALPTEAPADPWAGGELAVPGSGPITEVVPDTVFEGTHTFYIGTNGETPFQVRRFENPERIVVDVAS